MIYRSNPEQHFSHENAGRWLRIDELRNSLEKKHGEKVYRITRGEMLLGYGLKPERLPK